MKRNRLGLPALFITLTLLFLMFGCPLMSNDENDDVTPPSSSETRTIGPEGGIIETGNGAKIDIPPDALSQNETITIYSYPSNRELPASWCPIPGIAGVLRLEPHLLQFDKAVTITVPLNSHWTPGNQIPLYVLNSGDDRSMWQDTGENGTISADGLTFFAEITHFSGYGGGSPEGFLNGDSLETFKADFTRWYMDVFMQDDKIRCKNNNCYKLAGVDFELGYKRNAEEGTDFWRVDDTSGDPDAPLIMVDYVYDISNGQSIDGYVRLTTTNYYSCTKPMLVMRSDSSILKEGETTTVYADMSCAGIALVGKEISFNIQSGPGQVNPENTTTNGSGSASTTFTSGPELSVVRAYHNSCPGDPGEEIEVILPIAASPDHFNLAISFTQTMFRADPYINETVGYSGSVSISVGNDNGDGTADISGSGTFPVIGSGEVEYNDDENCTTETTGEVYFTYTGTLVTDSEGEQSLHLTQETGSDSTKTVTCPDATFTNPGLVLGGVVEFIFPVENGYTMDQQGGYGPITNRMIYTLTF